MRLTNSIGFDYDFSVYVHSTAFLNSFVSPLIFFFHHLKKTIYKRLKRLAQGRSPADSSTDVSSKQTGSTGISSKPAESSDTSSKPTTETKDKGIFTLEPKVSPNHVVITVDTQDNPLEQVS